MVDLDGETDQGHRYEHEAGAVDGQRPEPDKAEDESDCSEHARKHKPRARQFEYQSEEPQRNQDRRERWVGEEVQELLPRSHVGADYRRARKSGEGDRRAWGHVH